MRFEIGWALLSSPSLTVKKALALITSDLEKLLGLEMSEEMRAKDWIAVEGMDLFGFGGKVVAAGGAGEKGEQVAIW